MTKEEFLGECKKAVEASKVAYLYFAGFDENLLIQKMGDLYSKIDQEGSIDETSAQFIEALAWVQRKFISLQDQAQNLFRRYRENCSRPKPKEMK